MQQFAQDDKPREWLVQEHDDGIFHISRYVQLFPSPVQRLRGFIQRLFFLYTSLRLLWDFNLSLFQQAPHCFAALAASKAVMALQGAARLYVHALLMKSCQKYLNSEIGEYHLLPILLTVLLLGLVPTVVRHYMLWPRGRIALLCNLEVDSRLMRGFAELREEDREDENVKDLSQEASRLKVGEGGRGGGGGGGGGSRPGGFLGAEEVFGVASESLTGTGFGSI